ncbi:MAG: hypothetical protein A3E80_06335 [Chlamydiae bacterium RIFCSPHIGHO2_12_FULL_49_9]|nr:MAG: hypothetical protein A3E80_06335 [Chlamydiae bacterium RIFCSPHIGHO2_12_FULL_49_9]
MYRDKIAAKEPVSIYGMPVCCIIQCAHKLLATKKITTTESTEKKHKNARFRASVSSVLSVVDADNKPVMRKRMMQ